MRVPGKQDQHYNYEQKLFELGGKSTLAIAMWGLGGLETLSYRTMIAKFADDLVGNPASSVEEIAKQWNERFWAVYRENFGEALQRYNDLARITPRTEEEERELWRLRGLSGGFCVAGHMQKDRIPHAFEITYGPEMADLARPEELQYDVPRFWGCPNLMYRLILGMDDELFAKILRSQNWQGSAEDLYSLIRPGMLRFPGSLPLREGVDWI